MVCRELDPVPLNLGLGQAGKWHGPQIDMSDVLRLKNAAERAVATEVALEGDKADRISLLVGQACIVTPILALLAWAGVAVVAILEKGGF